MKRKVALKKSALDGLRPLMIILVSAIFFISFSVVVSLLTRNWIYLPAGVGFLIVEIALFWVTGILFSKSGRNNEERVALLNGMTLDFMMALVIPIVILSEEGEILWYNNAFQNATGETHALYHQSIQNISPQKLSLRRLREESPDEQTARPVIGHLNDEQYQVVSYKISSGSRTCLVTFWDSLEEVRRLRQELTDKNPVVAYIAVDNYAEAAGFLQGNYRTVTAQISMVLKDFAKQKNAILREVENDRYILILEEKHLNDLCEKRFDILDQVRAISSENMEIPVTISIGAAAVQGDMITKEEAAQQALSLALQRGGDQAVLKRGDNSIEYFGGRTKTVQKQTKIRSRIVASQVKNLIENASNVLIMGHRFADHDSIGSCVGMARFAMQYGAKVNIVVNVHDSNLKGAFKKLIGLADYKNIFLDGPTAQDLIRSTTLLIITDVNNVNQFEAPELFENAPNVVIIDHHRQSDEFLRKPDITYIEPSASSASELVAEMLEQQFAPGSILKEEAELLFAGIILDTKQFTNNTGPRTFAAAHYLRSEGGSPAEANMLFRSDLDNFKREIKYESNAFIYRDIIAFSYIEDNATQDDKIAASKAADRLLSLNGVLASFVLCRIDQTVHISARSSGTVNVQLITEKLHGGGHFDMAGAQVKNATIKETFVYLKKAVDEYLNEI